MEILFEGPCAYAVKTRAGYEIRVHSSNYTTHMVAGSAEDAVKAETTCKRLNAYPRQTRAFHGLL